MNQFRGIKPNKSEDPTVPTYVIPDVKFDVIEYLDIMKRWHVWNAYENQVKFSDSDLAKNIIEDAVPFSFAK